MTADSSNNNNSPRSNSTTGDGSNASRRSGVPWSQIVRGETETIPAVPRSPSSSSSTPIAAMEQTTFSPPENSADETQMESSDISNGNASLPQKPVWNKPSNYVVEVSTVMGGAVSWPALSESTRPTPKLPSDSLKPASDKSISVSQGPIISHSPKKHATSNANLNSTPNNKMPVRQRSMNRGGSTGGGSSQSAFGGLPTPLPSPLSMLEIPHGNLVPAVLDSPVRETPYKGNNWDARPMGGVGSQPHTMNDHASQRNPPRRGNFRPRIRGDGLHHNGHGGRRDQDRDWNSHRVTNPRDVHMPHQMVPPPSRGFVRQTLPDSTPFITPHLLRPFGNYVGFDMASPFVYFQTMHPDSFRGVPLVPHAPPPPLPPTIFPSMDPSLPTLLVNQIEYYFSDDNLVKDNYLRSFMDDQGWVSINLIARFPRVQQLTHNIQFILDSLRVSTVVEVQGDKMRRRNEWRKWIPATGRLPTDTGSEPIESTDNMLATSFQNVTLDNVTNNQNGTTGTVDAHTEEVVGDFSSEESSDQLKRSNGDGNAEEDDSSMI